MPAQRRVSSGQSVSGILARREADRAEADRMLRDLTGEVARLYALARRLELAAGRLDPGPGPDVAHAGRQVRRLTARGLMLLVEALHHDLERTDTDLIGVSLGGRRFLMNALDWDRDDERLRDRGTPRGLVEL